MPMSDAFANLNITRPNAIFRLLYPGIVRRTLPPLVHSLERHYLGESQLVDNILPVLAIPWEPELCVLNLSLNDNQEMTRLEETYFNEVKILSVTRLKIFTKDDQVRCPLLAQKSAADVSLGAGSSAKFGRVGPTESSR